MGLDFLDKAEMPKTIELKLTGMVSKWFPKLAVRDGVKVIVGIGIIKFFKKVIMRSPDGTPYEASFEVTPRYVPGTVPPVHNSGEEGTLEVSVSESLGSYYSIAKIVVGSDGKKRPVELRTDAEINEAAKNHEFFRLRFLQTPNFLKFNGAEAVKIADAEEVKVDLQEVARALLAQQQSEKAANDSHEDSHEDLGEDVGDDIGDDNTEEA